MVLDIAPSMRGRVVCVLRDGETGRIEAVHRANVITNQHRNLVAEWLAGGYPPPPDYIAVGTGAEAIYAEANQSTVVDLTSSGADSQLAQGFIVSTPRTINSALFYLARLGTSSGTLTAEIQSDTLGYPSGVALATSDALAINGIPLTLTLTRFVFPNPPLLTNGPLYHLVLKSAAYTYSNGVTEIQVGTDNTASSYSSGQLATYSGAVWSQKAGPHDAIFRVIAKPDSGYTAIIGETTRVPLTSKTLQGANTARLLASFTTTQAVGRHGMIGLFNASSAGILSAAANIDLAKTNTQTLSIYWLITVN